MRTHRILIFLTLLGVLNAAHAGFDEGFLAYQRGDFTTALREWRPLAEQGYDNAQVALGAMYYKGQGLPQEYKQAIKWYRLAAEQGNVYAQYWLGVMYAYGQGVSQDNKAAIPWYRLAAEKGYVEAQSILGTMYHQGLGVPQDYKEAIKWYCLAAEQGDVMARKLLGVMYAFGHGVPEDRVAAYALLNGEAMRDSVATLMTPQEIEAGQNLTREMSNHPIRAIDRYLAMKKR